VAKKTQSIPASSSSPVVASSSPQPVYAGPADNLRRFCRAVIGQIASHVAGGEEEQLGKVALYQEIWYLVAKYEVPIADPSDDVVVVVDKLCRDDDSLDSLNIGEKKYLMDKGCFFCQLILCTLKLHAS
jgi:hypothetical protein